jgi:rfaE bifunctional protein nucleotidyltransferase chain/domain
MKIVATSGCFDLVHAGHVALFKEMRKLAGPKGLVIVLINRDEYLRQAKGPSRPIQGLEHRMAIVGAFRDVDIVLPFKDETPCRAIKILEPDIWVKGIEYSPDVRGSLIPEEATMKQVGGEVVYVDTKITVHTGHLIQQLLEVENGQHAKGQPNEE